MRETKKRALRGWGFGIWMLMLMLLAAPATKEAAQAEETVQAAEVTAPVITAPESFTVTEGEMFSLGNCHRDGCLSIEATHWDDSGCYGRFSMTAIVLNGQEQELSASGCVHYCFSEAGAAQITITAVDLSGNVAEVILEVTVLPAQAEEEDEAEETASETGESSSQTTASSSQTSSSSQVGAAIKTTSTYVEVDLTNQMVYLYSNGELILSTPCVSGDVYSGMATPTGVFSLTYKTTNATLRGAGYADFVYYWMPFYGNYGMHDATWRTVFGGTQYYYNGSHGCINLPLSAAATIYSYISAGDTVIVYGGVTSVAEPSETTSTTTSSTTTSTTDTTSTTEASTTEAETTAATSADETATTSGEASAEDTAITESAKEQSSSEAEAEAVTTQASTTEAETTAATSVEETTAAAATEAEAMTAEASAEADAS